MIESQDTASFVVAYCYPSAAWHYYGVFDTLKLARSAAAKLRTGTKFLTAIYRGELGGERQPD